MLSAREFTVGTLGDAQLGSLILPRTKYEETFLIGQTDKGLTAVVLSGQHAFQCFQSSGNTAWRGLIIPDVRIEVDEASVFEGGIGSIVRRNTHLVLSAKATQSFRSVPVVLEENLPPARDESAAFSKWRVILGENENKRLLFTIDLSGSE